MVGIESEEAALVQGLWQVDQEMLIVRMQTMLLEVGSFRVVNKVIDRRNDWDGMDVIKQCSK